MINYAFLLSLEQVEHVHDASLEILENVGLLVRNDRARSIFPDLIPGVLEMPK